MSSPIQTDNKISKDFGPIFFYAPMSIVITNASGKIVAANPFALIEFGFTPKELVGKRIEILVPVRFREKHRKNHKIYVENPHTRTMSSGLNLYALRKDGTEFPVEISLSNYKLGKESYSIAFVTNITTRKKSEEEISNLNAELEAKVEKRTLDLRNIAIELRKSKKDLEAAQSFQKALFENAGAMIIATNNKGIINFYNPEAVICLGYSEDEIINKQTPMLFHVKSEIDRNRKNLFKEFGITVESDFDVMVEKSKRNIHREEEYTYIRKDKTMFPVLLTITAIRNGKGRITGFMGVSIDITERKKAEDALLASLKKEKELNEMKSRFVSMASHEFRTPLSTILSSAYLIEKYTEKEDQHKREKHIQRIATSLNILNDILNDFLSVDKLEDGKMQIKPSRFDIEEFIIGMAAQLKNTLKQKQKIKYRHEGDKDVFIDASLLMHILMNLISNASKFSPEGKQINITTTCSKSQLIISVKDKGIGIPKEDQEHIMERFFRAANADSVQGTGLGLHIVAKYAELMDGSVQFISELDKGSEFIITFKSKTM